MAKSGLSAKLTRARKNKNDEFYTQLCDIENELEHYKSHFKNKVVYCNCDDPRVSNFFRYFFFNFESLGLKKLIVSCYKEQSMDFMDFINRNDHERAIYINERAIYIKYEDGGEEIETKCFKGDGDFRSQESIDLLKQSDIVVTNPPFSLFREYVAQLMEYDKKFLIIGNINAVTYKDIFRLIKANKIWLGHGFKGMAAHFINKGYENYATARDHKEGMIRVSGVVWYTNIDTNKPQKDIVLCKKYNPAEYPKYDNYDAIEVSKTKNIPMDYEGVMGVPITFFVKYNPAQFEILGLADGGDEFEVRPTKKYKNVIRINRDGSQVSGNGVNGGANILCKTRPENRVCYTADGVDGYLKLTYKRFFIKNKKVVKAN